MDKDDTTISMDNRVVARGGVWTVKTGVVSVATLKWCFGTKLALMGTGPFASVDKMWKQPLLFSTAWANEFLCEATFHIPPPTAKFASSGHATLSQWSWRTKLFVLRIS